MYCLDAISLLEMYGYLSMLVMFGSENAMIKVMSAWSCLKCMNGKV